MSRRCGGGQYSGCGGRAQTGEGGEQAQTLRVCGSVGSGKFPNRRGNIGELTTKEADGRGSDHMSESREQGNELVQILEEQTKLIVAHEKRLQELEKRTLEHLKLHMLNNASRDSEINLMQSEISVLKMEVDDIKRVIDSSGIEKQARKNEGCLFLLAAGLSAFSLFSIYQI